MPSIAFLCSVLLFCQATSDASFLDHDLREDYDVLAYELDLRVDPEQQALFGTATIRARVTADRMSVFQLDLVDELKIEWVRAGDDTIEYTHANDGVQCQLPAALVNGDELSVTVRYSGHPRAENSFSGFHWETTADGSPWINTSCQGPGAHSWWPCKSSFYHPEDKPESIAISITVPQGLYAVSNGRLQKIDENGEHRTFHWLHDYPIETYAVTLNVAPYVVVEKELDLPGYDSPLLFAYYVLPENAEKAALQFEQVPELIRVYSDAFGPFPFERSKFGLVETNFWGMEHSTAVAYGSSYPAWCEKNDEQDRFAGRNRFFDYILIHEVAHEWWGNGVSATEWGHFWIHEGFGTYAEGVYVERTQGRARADEFFAGQQKSARRSGKISRLYRGEDVNSGQAYAGVIYSKGAAVLNTFRVYMDDDEAWWRAIREFNLRFRYKNASTDDFRRILEEVSGHSWRALFDAWVYGEGYPELTGSIRAGERSIELALSNLGSGETEFELPLDLAWTEAGEARMRRVFVPPGVFSLTIDCGARPEDLRLEHLDRVFGDHQVDVN